MNCKLFQSFKNCIIFLKFSQSSSFKKGSKLITKQVNSNNLSIVTKKIILITYSNQFQPSYNYHLSKGNTSIDQGLYLPNN